VEEGSDEKRKGIILASDRVDAKSPPLWLVLFEGETLVTRAVPFTRLKVIKDKRIFEWTIVKDSFPGNPVHGFQRHGVIGFPFGDFTEKRLSVDNENYSYPFLRLLIHLWPGESFRGIIYNQCLTKNFLYCCPGNWRVQLGNLNIWLEVRNATIPDKKKRMSLVSEQGWWTVWGVIISACPSHKGGQKLFEKPTERGLSPTINLGKGGTDIISWHRFKSIKEKIHYAFFDKDYHNDPWHPIKLLIDGFNENRMHTIAAAIKIVLDELMSPFQP
jgi:hypothetical protein